jgi:hypothetical protein
MMTYTSFFFPMPLHSPTFLHDYIERKSRSLDKRIGKEWP